MKVTHAVWCLVQTEDAGVVWRVWLGNIGRLYRQLEAPSAVVPPNLDPDFTGWDTPAIMPGEPLQSIYMYTYWKKRNSVCIASFVFGGH